MLIAFLLKNNPNFRVIDCGSAAWIGPELINIHVHLNEPGRKDWEEMATTNFKCVESSRKEDEAT